jgi:hypothetical protein
MAAVFDGASDLIGFGDKAFHAPVDQDRLLTHHITRLYAALRQDALAPWSRVDHQLATRLRRRTETALSVLTTVFNLEPPASRLLSGLIVRVATRILSHTLCFITGSLLAQSPV